MELSQELSFLSLMMMGSSSLLPFVHSLTQHFELHPNPREIGKMILQPG
jgi:hypothetical protein